MKSVYHPFPATHWSLVHRAAETSELDRREALATLLNRYQPALRSYLRTVRHLPPDVADDLLQSFIADKFLEQQLLRHADEKRGRFRTFLLSSLNNFLASQFRASSREPALLPRDPDQHHPDAPDPRSLPADHQVETAWARALVQNVLTAMHQECQHADRLDVWNVFAGRVLAEFFENRQPLSYEYLADQLRLQSPTQAANLLVTGKRMYARLLRTAIAEYEIGEDAVNLEIAELRAILSRGIPEAE